MANSNDADAERGARKGEVKPEWIRPKQVKELFGLGTNKGTRLLSYPGLCAYLDGLAAEQEGGAA
jgi:hypothetical protein